MPSSLNGTGVTFNDATTLQSGNIPTANLGSGTANSGTFLRGDKTWQALSVPASPGTQLFTSSGTFTVPAGVTLVKVTAQGGGGGGGGGDSSGDAVGTGGTGGGGGIAVGFVSVTPGSTHTVTVGAGGAGTNSYANGSAGGTSSFGSVLSASGGGGGARGTLVSCGSDSTCGVNGANGSAGVGSGTNRNTALAPIGSSQYVRVRGTSKTAAIAYSLGLSDGAGAGGQGEVGASNNNAAGGVGGAVLVEW